jgi:hypothetical protein
MSSPTKHLGTTVVALSESQEAAASFAECFSRDSVTRYYLQISDCKRALQLSEKNLNLLIYECLTAAHCCNGLVIAAGPSYHAGGLWLQPNSNWNWKTYCKSRMWLLWWQLGREGRKRFGSWYMLEGGMISVVGSGTSVTWIFADLGTKEISRGRGYATAVMEYGISLESY